MTIGLGRWPPGPGPEVLERGSDVDGDTCDQKSTSFPELAWRGGSNGRILATDSMHTHETVVARVAVNSKLTCTDAQVFIDYVRNRLNSSDDTMESFDGAFHAIIRTQRDVSSLILAAIQEEPRSPRARPAGANQRNYATTTG